MGDGWSIAWRVHDAQFWGVAQRRRRVSVVGDFGGLSAPDLLFEKVYVEPESLRGDSAESGEKRESVAAASERSPFAADP